MVILSPMFQVGCCSASAGVIRSKSRGRPIAERPARGREQDAVEVLAALPLEALEDGAVLAVDRQDAHAAPRRASGHQRPGHDQGFLVGQRDRFAGIDGRQRRAKPGAAHHGRKRDLRGFPRPHGGIPGIAVQNPGAAGGRQQGLQLPGRGLVEHGGRLGGEEADLFGQQRHVALRGECRDGETLRELPDHAQRIAADGTG